MSDHAEMREVLDRELRALPKPITSDAVATCARKIIRDPTALRQFDDWTKKNMAQLLGMLNG